MEDLSDYRFSRDHMWVLMGEQFVARCGITQEMIERIGPIAFVELPEKDMPVVQDSRIGLMESTTDVREFRSPLTGDIVEVNLELEGSTAAINRDPYGEGWLFSIDVKSSYEFEELMDAEGYRDFCAG